MIGSITKPLTTLLQARVVDEGLLSWQTPLKKILPSFEIADASTTSQFELQHTACACTGMPRRDLDFIFEFEDILPEERIKQLKILVYI
jgi:CubicO group peptidase (beta-lactamase class C family)